MTKNEIVARWLGAKEISGLGLAIWRESHWVYLSDLKMDHNLLHEAWVKFRDLKFEESDYMKSIRHGKFCDIISNAIVNKLITEAFDELVKGVEWAEPLKK